MKKIIFIIICEIILCQGIESKIIWKIPFTIKNGLFVLDYTINGKTLKFVYDTGAGFSIIDSSLAKSLGINPSEHKFKASTFGGTNLEGIWSDGKKEDKLLPPLWVISKRSNFLDGLSKGTGVHIDGFLGYSKFIDRFVIEYNFEEGLINLHDSIPDTYKTDKQLIHQPLYPHPYFQKITEHFICIKGVYTVLDTVQIETFCILDTGSRGFLFTLCNDSVLFRKMLKHRNEKVAKESKNVATTYLSIPGLLQKKPLSRTRIYPQFQETVKGNFPLHGKNISILLSDSLLHPALFRTPSFSIPYFSNNITYSFLPRQLGQETLEPAIDIFLGIPFLVQYRKVIIDWRNRMSYYMQ